jgi:hypothetical protein
MEATCSSETSDLFQRTTWRYIPEDATLHNHRCENLKFFISCSPKEENWTTFPNTSFVCKTRKLGRKKKEEEEDEEDEEKRISEKTRYE